MYTHRETAKKRVNDNQDMGSTPTSLPHHPPLSLLPLSPSSTIVFSLTSLHLSLSLSHLLTLSFDPAVCSPIGLSMRLDHRVFAGNRKLSRGYTCVTKAIAWAEYRHCLDRYQTRSPLGQKCPRTKCPCTFMS